MGRLVTASLLVMLSMTGIASAAQSTSVATLKSSKGSIMVDTGAGFKKVPVGTPLAASDRVLVGKNSSVTLHFSPTCERTLTARGVTTVGVGCPDAAPVLGGAGAAGAGTIAGLSGGTVAAGVIGVAAVGTIIGVAAGGSSGDNGTPPSAGAVE